MDCSFQSPAPFREQRAYRGEYSTSWKPRFSKEFKESFLYRGKFFEKSFLYKGNILRLFFLYKGKCCIFAPRLT